MGAVGWAGGGEGGEKRKSPVPTFSQAGAYVYVRRCMCAQVCVCVCMSAVAHACILFVCLSFCVTACLARTAGVDDGTPRFARQPGMPPHGCSAWYVLCVYVCCVCLCVRVKCVAIDGHSTLWPSTSVAAHVIICIMSDIGGCERARRPNLRGSPEPRCETRNSKPPTPNCPSTAASTLSSC